ncbi:MAG: DNA (cytosine-5-)-methyltransferase [Gemmatimonadaceae bacterium]
MKFIDLFAGLGGFHLALSRLGHTCVFACEIDEVLRKLYKLNFGIEPHGDVRTLDVEKIPRHEILCAGFPCQPFSKAGDQEGFACPKNGDLFDYVLRITARHRPKFLLLENVPNLKWHNNGDTLGDLERRLTAQGYRVKHERLSPHHFGIPQVRERIFIVAALADLEGFKWPATQKFRRSIRSILTSRPKSARALSPQVLHCLDTWQRFITTMPADVDFPPGPLWSMEFGATYPYRKTTPYKIGNSRLRWYKGAGGLDLGEVRASDRMRSLPSYARTKQKRFPEWKIRFIEQNRVFYSANKEWIDPLLPLIRTFPPSLQKLEWNCRGDERDIWQHVIQFRASGVRVKRPKTSPSLIAMTTTQVPIIGWEKRYMTPKECARLQSMQTLKHWPNSEVKAFEALGNAVNVHVVALVAAALLPKRRRCSSARRSKTRTSGQREAA